MCFKQTSPMEIIAEPPAPIPQDSQNLMQLNQKVYPIFCNRGYNRRGLQFS